MCMTGSKSERILVRAFIGYSTVLEKFTFFERSLLTLLAETSLSRNSFFKLCSRWACRLRFDFWTFLPGLLNSKLIGNISCIEAAKKKSFGIVSYSNYSRMEELSLLLERASGKSLTSYDGMMTMFACFGKFSRRVYSLSSNAAANIISEVFRST